MMDLLLFRVINTETSICTHNNLRLGICISNNTGKSALPDICARCLKASVYISGKTRVPVL